MPDTLYVSKSCPHSQKASSFLAHAPTTLQRSVVVHDINYKNTPPSVTRVPTLITQKGKMLVGSEVFDYLKKKRQDPTFPQTPEMSELFHGLVSRRNLCLFLIIAIIAGVCCYYKKKNFGATNATVMFSQFMD